MQRALLPVSAGAFTIMEVLVSALLIAMAMGSIMAINTHAIHTLRATRQAAASSQVLQQRVEMLRARPWPEIASSAALTRVLAEPTESEKELADAGMAETLKVTVPVTTTTGPADGSTSFTVARQNGHATADVALDLASQPVLMFEGSLTWKDVHGFHRRTLRTMLCRAGLTRSGIFGSALGRAGGAAPPLPPP
jgi:Tfp pilus assembly protein PilV